jgi:ribosomal RNA methyltransferase Nop2
MIKQGAQLYELYERLILTSVGMPEPLDETIVSRKRAAPAAAEAPERKKRSRIAAREKREALAKLVPKTRVAGKPVKPANGATKANAKPMKAAPVLPTDDEDEDLDSEDLMDDSDVVTGLDALGSASEESDAAFDSDEEITKAGMWSSDDDEDDLEERLTAANM